MYRLYAYLAAVTRCIDCMLTWQQLQGVCLIISVCLPGSCYKMYSWSYLYAYLAAVTRCILDHICMLTWQLLQDVFLIISIWFPSSCVQDVFLIISVCLPRSCYKMYRLYAYLASVTRCIDCMLTWQQLQGVWLDHIYCLWYQLHSSGAFQESFPIQVWENKYVL
jgi:hypothetical protein